MNNIKEKILLLIMIVLLIWLVALIIQGNRYTVYCEENPNDEQCILKETKDSTIKCGWVFGQGFKCGIGF